MASAGVKAPTVSVVDQVGAPVLFRSVQRHARIGWRPIRPLIRGGVARAGFGDFWARLVADGAARMLEQNIGPWTRRALGLVEEAGER